MQGHQALSLARELAMRAEEGKSLRVLGETAAARGQFERARACLNASLSLLQEVGDEHEEARSQLSLAGVYVAQGKPEAGQAVLDHCIPAVGRCFGSGGRSLVAGRDGSSLGFDIFQVDWYRYTQWEDREDSDGQRR